ncbi:hypothetical protein N431DRAFT_440921 [Stipitochalara longipes BDJ]|nr:hypothetical protein N431DRAFT_440921 [Stipitochalara longipes BDJ]
MELTKFPDPIDQLQWIIDTQGLDTTAKQRLETIKTSIAVLNNRHEEVMKKKESKILALEFQLISSASEKAQQTEKISQLEGEKTALYEENIQMKEENFGIIELRELVLKTAGIIEEQDQKLHNLEAKVATTERALVSARAVNLSLRGRVNGQQRRNRRIAMKLLASVMELNSDVAVPGRQRPTSERQSFERASPNRSDSNADPIQELHSPDSTPRYMVLPFIEDFSDSDDPASPISFVHNPTAQTHADTAGSQATISTPLKKPATEGQYI